MKEYCLGTKLFPGFHREVACTKQKAGQKKEGPRNCVHENVSSTSCLCNATWSLVSSRVSLLLIGPSAFCFSPSLPFSLTLSLSLFHTLSRAPARIFFFNLIYRQFDGRKTRRHFCLSPYSPAGPSPSFHPHVARRKAIKIHNPGHTPRG